MKIKLKRELRWHIESNEILTFEAMSVHEAEYSNDGFWVIELPGCLLHLREEDAEVYRLLPEPESTNKEANTQEYPLGNSEIDGLRRWKIDAVELLEEWERILKTIRENSTVRTFGSRSRYEIILDVLRELGQWKQTATRHSRNEDLYREIVDQIGNMFGQEARTTDDGTVGDSVLALKVPELVARLLKPAPEYRTLSVGDVIEAGDQAMNPKTGVWEEKASVVGHTITEFHWIFRREVRAKTYRLLDAGEAVKNGDQFFEMKCWIPADVFVGKILLPKRVPFRREWSHDEEYRILEKEELLREGDTARSFFGVDWYPIPPQYYGQVDGFTGGLDIRRKVILDTTPPA